MLEFTDENFEEVVIKSDVPVIVDFWAEWCGPCRMIGPLIEQISEEYNGRIIAGKVDIESSPKTAMRFGIRNIPTILFLKAGEVVDKQVGVVPKTTLAAKLEKIL